LLKQHIFNLLGQEIKDHGIVVWYDPHRFYTSIIDDEKNIRVPVLKYENSFFHLRSMVEPYFNNLDKPELIIYINRSKDRNVHPLIELEKAGTVLGPDCSLKKNTSPPVLIREALKQSMSADYLNEIVSKVENGILSFEEVEKLADKHEPLNTGTLSLIFKSDDPQSIILAFLTDESLDKQLKEKKALKELKSLVSLYTGFQLEKIMDLKELRTFIFENLLLYDFFSHFETSELGRFAALVAAEYIQIQNINNIAQQWRLRHDLWDQYHSVSSTVAEKYLLPEFPVSIEKLIDVDTFSFIEDRFISYLCELDSSANIVQAKQTLENRKTKFWHKSNPEIGLLYSVLTYGIDLKLSIAESLPILNQLVFTFEKILNLYIGDDQSAGWYLSDHYFRLLENKYFDLDVKPSFANHLELFINSCRNAYSSYLTRQTSVFLGLLKQKGTYLTSKQKKQSNIFKEFVYPNITGKIKTAYILVDAFRYEMAIEFLSILDAKSYPFEILSALSSIPTITEFGMLSLVLFPGDNIDISEVNEKLQLSVGDKALKDRSNRFEYLSSRLGFKFDVFKLAETVQRKRAVTDKLKKSDFVIITSQEIDKINEDGNEILARKTMDDLLNSIKRSVVNLGSCGFSEIIIVADHGYLLGAEVGRDIKINFPNGQGLGPHKRCWIGNGGHNPPNSLRFSSKEFGYNSDIDFVFPDGVGLFTVTGGENNYFHGGLSMQEMVIPVIKIKSQVSLKKTATFDNYTITCSKTIISNRIFTVRAEFASSELSFDTSEPLKKRVRFKVISGINEVGRAETADYGFNETTKEIELIHGSPNVITIVISETEGLSSIDILMLDSATDLELAKLKNISVKLTF